MKTALILGASNGIGAEIAKEFAKCGYFVIGTYNKSETGAIQVFKDISNGAYFKLDISNHTEVDNLFKKVLSIRKTIDVLIISSGISNQNLLIDASIEEIQNIINVNLLGTIYACKAASKIMLSQHSGKIITIASMWGEVGASMESVYSASKGGVIAFTKALAKEIGYNGINVNCISPGLIDTKMNNHLSNEDIDSLIENTPSSRIGLPQDIAKAAIYLASDDASYINGQIISINGGFII